MSETNDIIERALAQAIQSLPNLLELARELAPYARKPAEDIKLSSLPDEANSASSPRPSERLAPQLREAASLSGPSESSAPRSGKRIAYPQHSPATAKDIFEVGLGANKLYLPGALPPNVYNSPYQSESTPIDNLSLPGAPFSTMYNTPSQSKSTGMDIASLLK